MCDAVSLLSVQCCHFCISLTQVWSVINLIVLKPVACVTQTATCHFPLPLMWQTLCVVKEYFHIFLTAFCTLMFICFAKIEVTLTVFSSLSPVIPLTFVALWLYKFRNIMLLFLYFLVSFLFLFLFFQRAESISASWAASRASRCTLNLGVISQKREKIKSPSCSWLLHSISLLYIVVLLSLCCCFSSHISGGNKSEIVNIHVLSLVTKKKKKRKSCLLIA